MNIYNLISTQPNCSICNLPMKEWDFWGTVHYHTECIANKISDDVMVVIKEQFEKSYKVKGECEVSFDEGPSDL